MWQDSLDPMCQDSEELNLDHYWAHLVKKDPEDWNAFSNDDHNMSPSHKPMS